MTKTKKKKGKGKKKVNVVVKCDSFFNFFNTVEQENKEEEDEAEDDDSQAEDSPNMLLQKDLELGSSLRDDLVPLALEFYLGVVPQESDDDDDDMEGEGDSDDDEPPKKKKAPKADAAQGKDGKKQEECKQQ